MGRGLQGGGLLGWLDTPTDRAQSIDNRWFDTKHSWSLLCHRPAQSIDQAEVRTAPNSLVEQFFHEGAASRWWCWCCYLVPTHHHRTSTTSSSRLGPPSKTRAERSRPPTAFGPGCLSQHTPTHTNPMQQTDQDTAPVYRRFKPQNSPRRHRAGRAGSRSLIPPGVRQPLAGLGNGGAGSEHAPQPSLASERPWCTGASGGRMHAPGTRPQVPDPARQADRARIDRLGSRAFAGAHAATPLGFSGHPSLASSIEERKARSLPCAFLLLVNPSTPAHPHATPNHPPFL